MVSLEFSHVYGGYESQSVFEDLNLAFPKGSFIALTGPNGSGKSTLLKFIYKHLKPIDGKVLLEGRNVATINQKELAKHLGFVPQNGKLDYAFTVTEAVSMGRYAYGGQDSGHSVEQALLECDIVHLGDKLVTELSGGELQRVLLARALCQQGKVLLLDEPVNHLDVKHQRSIMELLCRLVEKGYTVICVLHDLLLVQIYSQTTLVLQTGKVVAYGPTETVFTETLLRDVYDIDAHQVYDPTLDRMLWLPTYKGSSS